MIDAARALYRRAVPQVARKWIRQWLREIPVRLRDLPADLRDRALPPARLRERVGFTSAREHFVHVGQSSYRDIIGAVREVLPDLDEHRRWLDFGCGAGRVARYACEDESLQLTGIDVDREAIAWCRRHLRGAFFVTSSLPPTPFEEGSFDVIYSVSVFTHFDEAIQDAWLTEMRRLLRPGGLLVATTQSERLTPHRTDLTDEDRKALRDGGFVFKKGVGDFNEDSAFHTRAYLERRWSRDFVLRSFKDGGLVGYLDLSVWETFFARGRL